MKRKPVKPIRQQGVALVIVLWVIMVLSLLIAGFAFTMDVETKVASFSRKELKAEMLARSGIEVVRMQLLLHDKSPTDADFDALNQAWATNDDLYVDHQLGEGKYTVTVTDEERKLPVNYLTETQLRNLMNALQLDPQDSDVIVDSILDWIQPGDLHRLNGAKNDYYESLSPPYQCKNGPMDRIEELLLVRGVTREIYDGTPPNGNDPGRPGLKDLLTVWSAGQVNANTASSLVLQTLLGVDESQTDVILNHRDGADGIPGTDDDQPFHTPAEVSALIGGANSAGAQQLQASMNVSSQFFHVKSVGEVGGAKYTIETVLRRQGGDCLVASWLERRGGS